MSVTVDLRLGDCLEVMRDLPDGCVDAVVMDPPYNIGYKYRDYADRIPMDDYRAWQLAIIDEAGRVVKDGGSLFYLHYPEFASYIWCAVGEDMPRWAQVDWITWVYHAHASGKVLRKASRAWLWFSAGDCDEFPGVFEGQYRNPTDQRVARLINEGRRPVDYDWWQIEQVKNVCDEKTEHPCQVPVSMVQRIVNVIAHAGGAVLDPFMGSGTTGVACVETGRNFIGIEIDPEYFAIAERRIAEAQRNYQPQLALV